MSSGRDRDRRLRAVDDKERVAEARREPPRPQGPKDSLSAALQRLLGVVGFLGALFALGSWLEAVGLGRQFSTLSTITIIGTLDYWAKKRPDLLVLRAGSYGRIAEAFNDSRADIRRSTYRRPIRAGFLISVLYGTAIVLMQEVMYFALQGIADWRLAVAAGALIGSVVVAPQLYQAAKKLIAQGSDDYDYYREAEDEGYDDEEEDYEDEEYDDEEYGEEGGRDEGR